MKRLLSAILVVSLLCVSTSSHCFAKTAWNTYNRENAKPISIFNQKDGEKIVVQGEKSPTIVINNKNESNSRFSAVSGSTSRSTSSASNGSSAAFKFAGIAIKAGICFLVARCIRKIYEEMKNMCGQMLTNLTTLGGFIPFVKGKWASMFGKSGKSYQDDDDFENDENEYEYEETFQGNKGFFYKIINEIENLLKDSKNTVLLMAILWLAWLGVSAGAKSSY